MSLTVKKTLIKYRQLERCLQERLEELELKQDALQSSLPEEGANLHLDLEEDEGRFSPLLEIKKQRLKATGILIYILKLKLFFIEDVIAKLEPLNRTNPRTLAPFDLQVRRFHDWVETNQQLYELNTELYEVEKSKWKMEESYRQRRTRTTPVDHSIIITTTSVLQIKQSVAQLDSPNMSLYVGDRLQPRDNRMTFEATKIEEYIADCQQYQHGSLDIPPKDAQGDNAVVSKSMLCILGFVRGAHPQSYHAFIEVLCNYIVERHRSSQGEDLPHATIYVSNVIVSLSHACMTMLYSFMRGVSFTCLLFWDNQGIIIRCHRHYMLANKSTRLSASMIVAHVKEDHHDISCRSFHHDNYL